MRSAQGAGLSAGVADLAAQLLTSERSVVQHEAANTLGSAGTAGTSYSR